MMSRVSIPIVYQTDVVRGGSLGLRGRYSALFGGAFRYRIGIGFVGIVVENLIVYGWILYQFYTKMLRSRWSCFEEIALLCGAS